MRLRSGQKKWIMIAVSVVGLGLILLIANEEAGDASLVSGTMASRASISLEIIEAAWSEGTGDESNHGYLDDSFRVLINGINQTNERRQDQLALYFSRDENFSQEEDCLIDQRAIVVEPSGVASVQFNSRARLIDCLDAGPWYAAVYSSAGGWSTLDTVYHIESGEAEVEIESLPSDVAPRGTMDLTLRVHRPVTETGFDGLYDFPVDIWLQQGETLCLIEADAISLARDAIVESTRSWKAAQVNITINLRDAKAVDPTSLTQIPFSLNGSLYAVRECADCTPPKLEGRCRLAEGPLKVTAGPTISGFHVVQETFHHAPPVVVEPGSFQVSVRSGQVLQVTRTAYNPSVRPISWSSTSVDEYDWLIGMKDQSLPPRKPSMIGFTISAVDLEPRVYTTSVSITTSDFYGTEIVLDVEVTVLPALDTVSEAVDESELPSTISLGNYPNPFNPTTTIQFELPQREQISLVVYDITGRQIRVLHDGELSAGSHEIRFDANDLPSGTYLYRLTTPTESKTGKMILVK